MTTIPSDPCDLYRNNPAARAVLEECRRVARKIRKRDNRARYWRQYGRRAGRQ